MGIMRFVQSPSQDALPEIRALVGRLRDAAARRSGEWACWIDGAGERFRLRVQDIHDTGRGFTTSVGQDALVQAFETFVDAAGSPAGSTA